MWAGKIHAWSLAAVFAEASHIFCPSATDSRLHATVACSKECIHHLLKTEDHHSPSPCLKVIARSTSRSATSAAGGHVTGLRWPPSVEQHCLKSQHPASTPKPLWKSHFFTERTKWENKYLERSSVWSGLSGAFGCQPAGSNVTRATKAVYWGSCL